MSDLMRWLQSLGLERYEETLRAHDVDLNVAPELTGEDLERLGLSLGHRRKFIAAAAKMRVDTKPAGGPAPVSGPGEGTAHDERRQVTVLFSDLVGSTALAGELDPEDLRRLLSEYRDACAAVIGRYEGHVAQYLGDGVLAYFGYPTAQEHAAERAVRAGLEIVEQVARLKRPDGAALESRVGIATGVVVAGGEGGTNARGEQTLVGDTPNLAARLQALAEPGAVLASPATHRLTGNFFEYRFAGEHALKGVREPVRVWRALGASAAESRFVAARAAVAAPIIGRERELAFLDDAWRRAARGNGHVVLISGEAGMGKSRLLEALAEHVRDQPHRLLRAQCSPYHRSSVLHPFIQLLRQRLDLRHDRPSAENLERVDRMLARIGRATRQARLLLAELLELPARDSLLPTELTPAQRKNATLEILEAFLVSPLDGGTVLLLIEDAHWSDPSTQGLVERVLARIEREQALVVVTHRPELKPAWAEHPQATTLRCKQLGGEHCAALARHVASLRTMDDALVREITERSDGVPLYVEELTKAVLELPAAHSGAVPHSLQDSLMARLDRLGEAKEIAQVASAIGRQFPRALLAAVAGLGAPALSAGLGQLREAGVLISAGVEEEQSYSFNHALVQDAAYESLSHARRKVLHANIARALEAGAQNEPTVIADHYGRAGEPEKAFHYWMRAADRSSERLAFVESIAALKFALGEAAKVADNALGARLKLDAQLKLGTALVFQKGPQSPETEAALADACRLAKELNAGPQLFESTWGLYLNAARNGRFDQAKLRGEELIAISDALGDEDLKYEALHHRWGFAYFMGRTADTLAYANRGVNLYDPARHHRFSYTFGGHDPCVCAYGIRAMTLGVAGDAAKIKPATEAALALAARLQHPLTLVFARTVAPHSLYFTRDVDACWESAEQLVNDATRYDLPANRAVGEFWLGATQGMRGDPAGGLQRMESAFAATHGMGFFASLPGVVMAETLAQAGRERDALALIVRLLGEMSDPEAGFVVSELWRIRGELAARGGDVAEAERSLGTALRIARAQEATLLQSRAGIALARFLAEQRRPEEAKHALAKSGVTGIADQQVPEVADAARLRAELRQART